MSGRKNSLVKYLNIVNGDMSGDLTSSVTNIEFIDNVGLQLNFSGSPVGIFSVQVSIDYTQDSQGVVSNAGNWISIPLNPIPAATGSANNIYIDLNQLSAPWVRVFYDFTSGTGTLNSLICGKML